MSNIITAVFTGCNPRFAAATPMSYQWDKGQILKIIGLSIPSGTLADFVINGDSVTQMISVADKVATVAVPDALFEEAGAYMIYIRYREDDATQETEYMILLTVLERAKPDDYDDPTPAEQSMFQTVIDTVEEGVQDAQDAAVLSRSWAVGGTGTRAGEDYNNSKFWAEMAAQQAADGGFVYFEIAYPGYLMMTRSDNLDDDIDFAINDSGELEVILNE
jgi:hypothetical protein